MNVQPYLIFEGRCEEAVEFYRKALGAGVETMMRFGDNAGMEGECAGPKPPADKVMHACLRIGEGIVMVSDGMCTGKPSFQGFSLSYTAKDADDAQRRFAALADGGQVQMPLTKTFFAPSFGMVADRFGVSWMVVTTQETAAEAAHATAS
jgi:PhnB protein